MLPEVRRLARLPRTMRVPFYVSPEQKASAVVGDLVKLTEFSGKLQEVGEVMGAIQQKKVEQNPYLGHPTKDIEVAIVIVGERIESGLLQHDIGRRYLDALYRQKQLSLQQPTRFRDKFDSTTGRLARGVMNRRGVLMLGGIAGVSVAGFVADGVYKRTTSPKIDPERQLDLQPKLVLSEGPSDLSRSGWRVKIADRDRFVPSINHQGLFELDNGYVFSFGQKIGDMWGNDGISIRGYISDGKVIPFFRVYPSQGTPKDYFVQTSKDKNGDLVTNVVVFEKPTRSFKFYTQFKPLVSGDTFKFFGYYLDLVP